MCVCVCFCARARVNLFEVGTVGELALKSVCTLSKSAAFLQEKNIHSRHKKNRIRGAGVAGFA